MREFAARICRDYLYGPWKSVTAQNIGFKHISGGLSNLLYHISLPESLVEESKDLGEPQEVLIRVYGQTHGEHALEALITESVVFTLLSERGLGPKLHGIFPGGRIEQYINARPLRTGELADEKLSVKIAQKMAAIHTMEVPLHKEPGWLWDTIDRWLRTCESKLKSDDVPEFFRNSVDCDFLSEVDWLKKRLEMENCPVVFCHNDMQEGNILIRQDGPENNNNEDPQIVVIDFEYCSYNYRSFDIANHFVEWVYDYTEAEYPFYKEQLENYPSKKQRLLFIKAYLEARGLKENPKKILREVEVFTLASHFFWGIWGIINAGTSQIPFGYWEYAAARLRNYFQQKKKFTLDMKPLVSSLPTKRKSCSLE
ncbi:choline/ethanolamine kinase isoform X2 [Tribolium castaneum]